jgi:hypothetical protein
MWSGSSAPGKRTALRGNRGRLSTLPI